MAKPEKATFEVLWMRGSHKRTITVEATSPERAERLASIAMAKIGGLAFKRQGPARRVC